MVLNCISIGYRTKRNTVKKNLCLQRPGIEPGPPAWQASILPLNQRCLHVSCLQRMIKRIQSSMTFKQNNSQSAGFEPALPEGI